MINLITAFFIIFLGFLAKRYPNLIAGYNTLPHHEKIKVDVDKLSSLVRNGMILMGVLILVIHFISKFFHLPGLTSLAVLIAVASITPFLFVQAKKYYKGHLRSQRKLGFIIPLLLLFVGVPIIIYFGFAEPKIVLEDRQLTISGMYGLHASVDNIELRESIPKILVKTNGYSLGHTMKGNFKLEEFGKCSLFIMSETGPYVVIKTSDLRTIIISSRTRKTTEELYNNLIRNL